MSKKGTFTNQMQSTTNDLIKAADTLAQFEGIYFDRGYDPAGADPIIDLDVASYEIAAADIAAMITLIQQLNNFRFNVAVASDDYDATINKIRTDK